MSVLVEAAVETLDGAIQAERDGAGRLELCADLARDGTTPSAGLIREVRQRVDIPVNVIIRPRPGDFHYDTGELAVMLADIRECRRAGADGVEEVETEGAPSTATWRLSGVSFDRVLGARAPSPAFSPDDRRRCG